MEFEIKGKYTIIGISDFLATTTKAEIEITNKIGDRYTFKQRGKRKEFYLRINKDSLVLKGFDIPFKVDSETGSFCGNACINMLGTPEQIKEFIDKFNLNPEFDKSVVNSILRCDPEQKDYHQQIEKLVYPELALKSGSNRLMDLAQKQMVTI